jgi:hypothetical protein
MDDVVTYEVVVPSDDVLQNGQSLVLGQLSFLFEQLFEISSVAVLSDDGEDTFILLKGLQSDNIFVFELAEELDFVPDERHDVLLLEMLLPYHLDRHCLS